MILTCGRGETPAWDIACTKDGTPVDLTGATVAFAAKDAPDAASAFISHDTIDGKVVISDPAHGLCVLTLTAADTDTLTVGRLYYTVTVTELDGTITVGDDGLLIVKGTPRLTFATIDEFAARIRQPLTSDDEASAAFLLASASRVIQDEAQQMIGLLTNDVLTMPGTTDDMVRLPERPVISVASVTLDGVTLGEGTAWYLEGNALCRVPANLALVVDGLIDEAFFPLGTGFGWASQTLEIIYTHGYEIPPETVKAICMEMVVRVWFNPGSVAREIVGNVSTVFDNMKFSPAGMLLNDDERRAIRRIFGRRARSLTMGR